MKQTQLAECERTRDKAIELLIDVTNQACADNDKLDSGGHRDYADALRFLAECGKAEIDAEYGRRVIAHWTSKKYEV